MDVIHLAALPVADPVEEVAVGEEVDARRVGEGEGDEAVVGRHQGRQQPVEDAPQLLTWQEGKRSVGSVQSVIGDTICVGRVRIAESLKEIVMIFQAHGFSPWQKSGFLD